MSGRHEEPACRWAPFPGWFRDAKERERASDVDALQAFDARRRELAGPAVPEPTPAARRLLMEERASLATNTEEPERQRAGREE